MGFCVTRCSGETQTTESAGFIIMCQYNSEVDPKKLPCCPVLRLFLTAFPPVIRSPKSHVSTDDACRDSSVGVFHSELELKTLMNNLTPTGLWLHSNM